MCNLYSLTTTVESLTKLRMEWDRAGRNIPPLAVYPDYFAPIVRRHEDGDVLSLARWGLPSLKDAPTDNPDKGTTNIRHPWFDDWKGYLGVEHRCLVPFDSFSATWLT
jgi:putative SOS response-associated peptidase YedK